MLRKVILDVDPGIADAVALAMALFDPRLEVVAVTACAGNVSPEQATRNVQGLIEYLDPPRWPRLGAAPVGEETWLPDHQALYGPRGLGPLDLPVAELHHLHPADKVIIDEVRAAPDQVTIVCLGPLSNLAAAMQRDPAVAGLIGRVVVCGGTYADPGDVGPVVEFNMACNPLAAHHVFHSRTTKTLIPLDVARQVEFGIDLLQLIPQEQTRLGRLLHPILGYLFRAYRERQGMEGVYLPEAIALTYLVQPELFQTVFAAGDIETSGELTQGATIFDRRPRPQWKPNIDVATRMNADEVTRHIVASLHNAARLMA